MAGEHIAFSFAPAIAGLPLVAFVVALAFGRYMPKGGVFVTILATTGSLLLSIWAAVGVAGGGALITRRCTSGRRPTRSNSTSAR